jgi:hypothetical protein
LGNSSQSLAPGILQKQDISLHLGRELCPSLWTNRPCFHKTLNTLFFKKNRAFFHVFKKNCLVRKEGLNGYIRSITITAAKNHHPLSV